MKTMVVKIDTCPKCKLRVIPKADGTCPNCHALIARPLATRDSGILPVESYPNKKTKPRPQAESVQQGGKGKRRKRFPLGLTLRDALRSTWQHKVLWLPAMILFTVSLAYTIAIFSTQDMTTLLDNTSTVDLPELFTGDRTLPTLIQFALMLLNILAYTFALSVTYKGARRLREGSTPVALGVLLRESGRYIWRLLLLYIALSFMIGIAMLPALGLLLVLGAKQGGATPTIQILFWVVIIPSFLILSVLLQYSTAALTLEDRSVNAAIRRGWQTFRRNAWLSLLLGVLLEVPLFLLSFLLSSPAAVMFARLTTLPGSGADASDWALTISMALGITLLFIALQAFYWIFRVTAWVFAWLRLTGSASKNPPPLRTNA